MPITSISNTHGFFQSPWGIVWGTNRELSDFVFFRIDQPISIGTIVEDKVKSTPLPGRSTPLPENEELADGIKYSARSIRVLQSYLMLGAFLGGLPVAVAAGGEPALLIAYVFGAIGYLLMVCAVAGFAVSILKYCEYRIRQGI